MKNVLLITLLALFAAIATAQEEKMATSDMANLDSDKDGKISKTEAAKDKALAKIFDALDRDKDGYLSAEELNS